MKPFEVIVAVCLGVAVATLAVPAWITKKEEAKQMASLESMARAGKALLLAEADAGHLPNEGWESYARAFGTDLRDPAWKTPIRDQTGWGLNRRTGLTLGDSKEVDYREVKSTDLPADAVLLMASEEPEFLPNRDGSINIPKGEPDPRDRHGNLSPYFLADGSATLLNKQDARAVLKLRTIPTSVAVAQAREEETAKIQEEWDKKTGGQAIYAGYIALESGEVATPNVMTGGAAEISFEVFSKERGKIETTLEFLNAEGKEINCVLGGPEAAATTNVDLESNEPYKYAPDLGGPLGFNPELGHAEKVLGANYRKGTKVTRLETTEEKESHPTSKDWATITRSPKRIPEGCLGVRLVIKKVGRPSGEGEETIIRNIKAKSLK
jgi:hypothetical protein